MTLQANQPAPIIDPSQATPVPTLAERTAALEAKHATEGAPAEVLALDPEAAAQPEAGDEHVDPDLVDAAQEAVGGPARGKDGKFAPKPIKPFAGAIQEPAAEDGEEGTDADLDKVAAAQRELVRERRERSRQQATFEAQVADFQRQQAEFARAQQQFLQMQQRLATPEGVLEFFEQQGGNGAVIGEYIVQANDPTQRAAREAKRELDPVRQELKKTQERIAEFERQQAVAQISNALTSRVNELAGSEEYAHYVPHTAAMLESDRDYFVQAADAACLRLAQKTDPVGRPLPFDYDDVIIEVEKQFAHEARRYGGQPKAATPPNAPARTPATKPPVAKAPAKPATQRAAAGGRTVMAEEDDLWKLSPKDRGAELERRYRGR